MTLIEGRVTNVWAEEIGSSLAMEADSGNNVLYLQDAYDFEEEGGGYLTIEGVQYLYVSADPESDIVTLDENAAADWEEGTRVLVHPAGIQRKAMLDLDDNDEGIEAIVPFQFVDRIPDGIRDPYEFTQETVTASDERGRWEIVAIGEEIPQVDGSFVDPETIPLPEGIEGVYAAADAAAAAAVEAAASATVAIDIAGKKVTWSIFSPGTTPNTAGDVWFQRDQYNDQGVIAQYEGLGGTSWIVRPVRDEAIANLSAGKLIAGSAFINALIVKTLFTLGDASTDGVIQSYDFANQAVGIFINKYGMVSKGGTFTGGLVQGAEVRGGVVRTDGPGQSRVEIDDTSDVDGSGGRIRWILEDGNDSVPAEASHDFSSGRLRYSIHSHRHTGVVGSRRAVWVDMTSTDDLAYPGASERGGLLDIYAGVANITKPFRICLEDDGLAVDPGYAVGGTLRPGGVDGTITLNGSYDYISGQEPRYFMDSAGNVHIVGSVTRGAMASGSTAFFLAAGFRPTRNFSTVVRTNTSGTPANLSISASTGAVSLAWTGTPGGIGLEAIFSTIY